VQRAALRGEVVLVLDQHDGGGARVNIHHCSPHDLGIASGASHSTSGASLGRIQQPIERPERPQIRTRPGLADCTI
jgi:hypothetical protein